jgi:hypothetical protein
MIAVRGISCRSCTLSDPGPACMEYLSALIIDPVQTDIPGQPYTAQWRQAVFAQGFEALDWAREPTLRDPYESDEEDEYCLICTNRLVYNWYGVFCEGCDLGMDA